MLGLKHRWLIRLLLPAILLLPSTGIVDAHEGPPYPIIVDKAVGPCTMSVWADPDIGTGTFFIVLEPTQNGSIPDDVKLEVAVQPVSGRLPEAHYSAVREPLRGQVQYRAEPQFDAQELWRVRIKLASLQGTGEITAEVEATPPGLGPWGILLYLFPFVVVGALWIRALMYRRRKDKAPAG